MEKPKVLIVEDQELVRTNLKLLLKVNNYDIAGMATNAKEAFEIIENNVVDLVIMDIALSGELDGIETARIIKDKWNIPVVYLTAKKDSLTISRAKETSPFGYISKDIEIKEQLPIVLEFALYKHKVEKEKEIQQKELADSEEKLRAIIDSASDAIIMLDHNGEVSLWNEAATRIFGFKPEEAIGKLLNNLITPDVYKEFYGNAFTDYIDDGNGDFIGKTIELSAIRKSNEVFPIEISMSSVKIKNKWNAIAIIRDISVRKQTEEEIDRLIEELQISNQKIEQNAYEYMHLNKKLRESEEKLKELNAAKDRFFSIIAHDLKAPFQALLGYSEILSQNLEDLNTNEIKEFATDLHNSAKQLFKLLENLLDWTRLQKDTIKFEPTKQNIFLMVKMIIDILDFQAKSKNITLINNVNETYEAYIDTNMINTVLRNLVSNAIKFTKPNGWIKITARDYNDDFYEISIQDNGIGIKPEDLDKLFRIDIKHTTLGTNQEKGTGLGLILCKELVEKCGGKIAVDSEFGKGTVISFTVRKFKDENNNLEH